MEMPALFKQPVMWLQVVAAVLAGLVVRVAVALQLEPLVQVRQVLAMMEAPARRVEHSVVGVAVDRLLLVGMVRQAA